MLSISPLDTLGPYEPNPTLAIAVSGGADSMALTCMAQEWVKARGGHIVTLIVDHRLRPESTAEAQRVAKWMQRYGIEHHILTWQEKPAGNVQAAARDARYTLLAEFCHAQGILHLLTAHHKDDQAETHLLQQARGSDTDGLAAMPSIRYLRNVRLLRPLLTTPKTELVALLTEKNWPWLEDPSNQNRAYARNRLRMDNANDMDRAYAEAIRHGRLRAEQEYATASLIAHCARIFPEGYATLDPERLFDAEETLQLRALTALAMAIDGNGHKPRHAPLLTLLQALHSGASRHSFHRCLWTRRNHEIWITREPAALEKRTLVTEAMLWDKRFHLYNISSLPDGKNTLHIAALGTQGLRQLLPEQQKTLKKCFPAAVYSVLPAYWRLERLVGVPHIGCNTEREVPHIAFSPAKALGNAPFSYRVELA